MEWIWRPVQPIFNEVHSHQAIAVPRVLSSVHCHPIRRMLTNRGNHDIALTKLKSPLVYAVREKRARFLARL